jgi:hypothetical protein
VDVKTISLDSCKGAQSNEKLSTTSSRKPNEKTK